MKIINVLVLLSISLFVTACGQVRSDEQSGFNQSENHSTSDSKQRITYSILSDNPVPGIKRSVTVRLNMKVSESNLRLIANRVKSKDTGDYQRTFITYYLPDMDTNGIAWATTHFDPELRIKILGPTREQDQEFPRNDATHGGSEIGAWIDQSPLSGGRITAFSKNGATFVRVEYLDGSSSTTEVSDTSSSSARTFRPKSNSGSGDYWRINAEGDLEIRDDQGLIATAKKLR